MLCNDYVICALLHPVWNHWLSLLSDWLSTVRFFPKSHFFFALNRIFFSTNENETVKQNSQSYFKVFFKLTNHIAGKWKKKAIVWKIGNFCCSSSSCIVGYWIVRFQNGFNIVAIGLQAVLVISNRIRAARSFDFEITYMISDQIRLHSVQLPLYTYSNMMYAFTFSILSYSSRVKLWFN